MFVWSHMCLSPACRSSRPSVLPYKLQLKSKSPTYTARDVLPRVFYSDWIDHGEFTLLSYPQRGAFGADVVPLPAFLLSFAALLDYGPPIFVKQSSGVAVNQECLEVFQQLKLGKKLKYIIYQLNDTNTEIVVEKTSESKDYDEFIGDLPPEEPRYAVYDFEYQKGDEGIRNKLCFFTWTPDESRIKKKMLYASSKDALRKALVGIATEVQGTDLSEVAYDTVLDRVSRGTS